MQQILTAYHPLPLLMDFCNWLESKCSKSPHFKFWLMTLHLEILLFFFLKLIRSTEFDLYVKTLPHIVPWFFSLDHQNYARWVSVLIRDMTALFRTLNKKVFNYNMLHKIQKQRKTQIK